MTQATPRTQAHQRIVAFVQARKGRRGLDNAVAQYNGIELSLTDLALVLSKGDPVEWEHFDDGETAEILRAVFEREPTLAEVTRFQKGMAAAYRAPAGQDLFDVLIGTDEASFAAWSKSQEDGYNGLMAWKEAERRTLAALPAPTLRWQPIDTASKNGRVILVNDTNESAAPWAAAKWLAGDEWSGWVYDDELMNDSQPGGPNPTLWFDIPSTECALAPNEVAP